MCHFHGYSEERAPPPCDEKQPPAKMSAYQCHFYGYIVENAPKYKFTLFCMSVLGRIQFRRPSKTASPAFCRWTKFARFGQLAGGGSFEMENGEITTFFQSLCLFYGYIDEKPPGNGRRLFECAICTAIARKEHLHHAMESYRQLKWARIGAISMAISWKLSQSTNSPVFACRC